MQSTKKKIPNGQRGADSEGPTARGRQREADSRGPAQYGPLASNCARPAAALHEFASVGAAARARMGRIPARQGEAAGRPQEARQSHAPRLSAPLRLSARARRWCRRPGLRLSFFQPEVRTNCF